MTRNVFRDRGLAEPEARNLAMRADLMMVIADHVRRSELSQTKAAQMARCKGCGRERVKYRGTLAKPITLDELFAALRAGNADATDAPVFAFNLQFSKLTALAEHYGVDLSEPFDRLALVYFLAVDHVPGFRVQDVRGRGRPRTNNHLKKLREKIFRKSADKRDVRMVIEEVDAQRDRGRQVTDKEGIAAIYRDAPAKDRNRLIKAMQKKVSKVRTAMKIPKTPGNSGMK